MFDFFKKIPSLLEKIANLEKKVEDLNKKTGILENQVYDEFPQYAGESGSLKRRITRVENNVLNHDGSRGTNLLKRVEYIENKLNIF